MFYCKILKILESTSLAYLSFVACLQTFKFACHVLLDARPTTMTTFMRWQHKETPTSHTNDLFPDEEGISVQGPISYKMEGWLRFRELRWALQSRQPGTGGKTFLCMMNQSILQFYLFHFAVPGVWFCTYDAQLLLLMWCFESLASWDALLIHAACVCHCNLLSSWSIRCFITGWPLFVFFKNSCLCFLRSFSTISISLCLFSISFAFSAFSLSFVVYSPSV